MKRITIKESKELYGYSNGDPEQVLRNGDQGYFLTNNQIVIVTCCRNCGDYSSAKFDIDELKVIIS